MKTDKTAGWLFVSGSLGVLLPYAVLARIFNYPGILRKEPAAVLDAFYSGGTVLFTTWWLFAMLGLPLFLAYSRLASQLENWTSNIRWIHMFGVLGLFAQLLGLLRWTFVIPILAQNHHFGDETTRQISQALFELVHQFLGVQLGEYVGQLFTIIWTIGISRLMQIHRLAPSWFIYWGYASSAIYLLAQAELFATVIADFPVWNSAGFLGSTLWILWMIALGILLLRTREPKALHS